MGSHRRSGWPKKLVGPQVALVEQDEEFLVVGSGVGIGEHESFKFGFAREPVGRTMAE